MAKYSILSLEIAGNRKPHAYNLPAPFFYSDKRYQDINGLIICQWQFGFKVLRNFWMIHPIC